MRPHRKRPPSIPPNGERKSSGFTMVLTRNPGLSRSIREDIFPSENREKVLLRRALRKGTVEASRKRRCLSPTERPREKKSYSDNSSAYTYRPTLYPYP